MRATRFLAFLVAVGALALAACGGSSTSPAASSVGTTGEDGVVTSSGYGPGTVSTPGTGTCTGDCAGLGNGKGPHNGAGNGYGPGPGPMDGFCGTACTGAVGPDPADAAEMLALALQEEYRAEALYRSVLATFGPETLPFSLIAVAEARHADAVTALFARRAMTPPGSAWSPSSFAPFASVALACEAGVAAEIADADFYVPYLQRTDLPQDIRNVFTNLQRASLENHLPAFEACR
jgi:rubrerythrin